MDNSKDIYESQVFSRALVQKILKTFFVRDDCYGYYLKPKTGKKASGRTGKGFVEIHRVEQHLLGEIVIGAHTTSAKNECLWICFDLDGTNPAKLTALAGDWSKLQAEKDNLLPQALKIQDELHRNGFSAVVEDSVGGYHIWVLFATPIPASLAYKFAHAICSDIDCERFPKQSEIGDKGFGNWVRMPGPYHSDPGRWSQILIDDEWQDTDDPWTWKWILAQAKVTQTQVEAFLSSLPVSKPEPPKAKAKAQIKTQEKKKKKAPQPRYEKRTFGELGPGGQKAVIETLSRSPGVCSSYEDFMVLVMAFKSRNYSYDDVDHVFRASGGYNEKENRKIYESTSVPRSITFGKAYHMAEQANPDLLKELLRKYPDGDLQPNFRSDDIVKKPEGKRSSRTQKILELLMSTPLDTATHDTTTAGEIIDKAMTAHEQVVLVEIPTGGGKTTATAKLAKRILLSGEMTLLYGGALKNDMYQFAELLGSMLTQEEKEKYADQIAILCSDSDDEITDATRIIITHKTFLSRKGFSTLYYAVLLWIKKTRAVTVIDEVEEYCERQQFWIQNGARYGFRVFRGSRHKRHEIYNQCRSHVARGNCKGCLLSDEIYITPNSFGILEVKPYIVGLTGPDYPPIKLDFELTITEAFYKTLHVRNVYARPADITTRICHSEYQTLPDGQPNEPDPKEVLKDIMKCSFQPRQYTTFPIDKETKEQVQPDQIAKKIQDNPQYDPKKEYGFPGQACEVKRVCLWDMSASAYIMQHASKTILLNAPMDKDGDERLFMEACAKSTDKPMTTFSISESKHKLTALGFFVFLGSTKPGEKRLNKLLERFNDDENILWFAGNQNKAQKFYHSLPGNFPAALHSDGGWNVTETDKAKDTGGARLSITYPHGPYGRAVNRPYDRMCFIDSQIYQPAFSLRPGATLDETAVEMAQRRKTTSRMRQCGGRILRLHPQHPDHPKAIIAYNVGDVDHIDIKAVATNFGGMVHDIQFCVVAESEDYLYFALDEYLTTGTLPTISEESWIAEQTADKKTNELSKKQRTTVGREEIRKERKDENRLDKLSTKIRELKIQNLSWKEIYQRLHLLRYPEIREKLREIYETE